MTTHKLVPVEPTEAMTRNVNRNCDEPDVELDWTWPHWLWAAPNEGRVSREQLKAAVRASDRYFFRAALFLTDRWTVEDRLGVDDVRWFENAHAAEMCRNEMNARAVIAALGLELEGE